MCYNVYNLSKESKPKGTYHQAPAFGKASGRSSEKVFPPAETREIPLSSQTHDS
jgi:hypothetical protein